MDARTLSCLAAAAALGIAGVSGAATAPEPPPACALPAQSTPYADRAGMLAQYERLPRACLTEIFDACTEAASRTLLDPGSAAVCSFGYEALLRQGFNGDFGALMAWWRSQRPPSVQ
ncbi:MAG TPA: hypothetical protein VEB23_02075 [Ramlibacter sp.]|nr:hypothetical protein [Ramlibacter sp.]